MGPEAEGGRFQMGRRVGGGTIGRIMYDLSYFRTRGLRVHLLCFCKRPRGPREIRWALGLFYDVCCLPSTYLWPYFFSILF